MKDKSRLSKLPLRIALAGCGRISEKHFDAIRGLNGQAELVGICDSDPERLEIAQASTHAPAFSSYSQMLREVRADVITLCTPSGMHAEQAIQAAEAGFHVICEKPMATRWQDGKAMVAAFDRFERQLFIVKQNRLNPTVQLLKSAIEQKRFGRIFLVNCNVFWSRPQNYYDSAKWRGTWELDGGAIMNQASHYVDLMDWLFGPIDSVHSFCATLARNIQVEDTGVVNLRWRSGTLGSVNVTMLTHKQNFEGSISVIGEKGTAKLGGVALNRIEHWDFAEPLPIDSQIQSAGYEPSSVYGNGHLAYYQNVIGTLTAGAEAGTDGREGLKSLETLVAIYRSARDRTRIALPLDL